MTKRPRGLFVIDVNGVFGDDANGVFAIDANGVLSGTYAVDGRTTSPLSVVNTDSQTALLNSFNTLDANGSWTLFLADMSGGDTSTLVSWGLQISVVPEPTTWAMMIFGSLAGLTALWRGARRRMG